MTSPKKPGVGFWATMGVAVVLVLYPLSFGPACWWFARKAENPFGKNIYKHAPRMYWPIGWLAKYSPRPLDDAIFWIAMRRDELIALPTDSDGVSWYGSRTIERGFK
jgi:hypothetical protein